MPLYGPSGGTQTLVKLDEVTLGGTQATIAFSSISGAYRSLEVHVVGRGTAAATNAQLLAQFNGDTGANYYFQTIQGNATTASAAESIAGTSVRLGSVTGSTAPANAAGATRVLLPGYSGTTFRKQTLGLTFVPISDVGSGKFGIQITGEWSSTAAITSILLLLSSGSFAAGSVASLYALL